MSGAFKKAKRPEKIKHDESSANRKINYYWSSKDSHKYQSGVIKKKIRQRLKESSNVPKFLEDNENSEMCSGKKNHVKRVQKDISQRQ